MPYRVCSSPGCSSLHEGTGRCPRCAADADKARRPNGNPYTTPGHHRFREAVLARHPRCVCTTCTQHAMRICGAEATVADHYPDERRDLVIAGLDPNDPKRGRGLCKGCHDRHTARTSPGGWNSQAGVKTRSRATGGGGSEG